MHIGKHEGITYDCTHCSYKATEPGKLKFDVTKHIKSIHEGIWYSCEKCDFKASTNGALKAHIKSRHAAKAL